MCMTCYLNDRGAYKKTTSKMKFGNKSQQARTQSAQRDKPRPRRDTASPHNDGIRQEKGRKPR